MAGTWNASKEGMSLHVRSPAFDPNHSIPARYTCEGEDRSPPLAFSGVPDGARSLALIVEDPDAPDPEAPKTTWVHWVLYNLPPYIGELREDMRSDKLPAGTRVALNSWNRRRYGGPCPPIGRHRYVHRLYALDTILPDLGPKAGKPELLAAIKGHVLEEAQVIGTYQKTAGRAG
jgi:Raf kinase inhibitor-like YbhB/YbcL family protein